MPFPRFEYMEFAKRTAALPVRWSLSASGFNHADPALIDIDFSRIRLLGPVGYGDPSIRARIAARYAVPEENVLPVAGTSLGIFLAAAALLEPGDRVLVEEPAYEAMLKSPLAVGAQIDRFPRRFEDGWRVDPERVAAAIGPRTKMIAISNLHNPTGVRLSPEEEARLIDLAASRGIVLFLDEVYRDFLEGPVGTAWRKGAPVVVASSLTKVYGLGGLRAGWVIAPADWIERMGRVVDLLHVNDPVPMTPIVEAAYDAADRLRAKNLEVAREGTGILRAWVERRGDLGWVAPDGGLCSFLRLPEGVSAGAFAESLLREEGTLVVPGHYFEEDRFVRIGVGAGPDAVRGGLEALGRILDR